MNTIYLGYDPRELEAYEVAYHSIRKRTDKPTQIIPLDIKHLGGLLTRPVEHKDGKLWCPISQAHMSTEFAISRFCIPFIERGWALFADCDIVCWDNIDKLFELKDDKYAVMAVKHEQESGSNTKMDGQAQLYYNRKNWSSVVLWNCAHEAHQRFTEQDLNSWPGRDMHAFKWLKDEEIGSLPGCWNWLVNAEPYPAGSLKFRQGIWHYTLGGPWLSNWTPAAYDADWLQEKASL